MPIKAAQQAGCRFWLGVASDEANGPLWSRFRFSGSQQAQVNPLTSDEVDWRSDELPTLVVHAEHVELVALVGLQSPDEEGTSSGEEGREQDELVLLVRQGLGV